MDENYEKVLARTVFDNITYTTGRRPTKSYSSVLKAITLLSAIHLLLICAAIAYGAMQL